MPNYTRKRRVHDNRVVIHRPLSVYPQYDKMLSVLRRNHVRISDISDHTPTNYANVDIMFMRDSFVRTPTHLILGKFRRTERTDEPNIVKPSIERILRMKSVELNSSRTRLEGGDYLLNRETSFILAGQRTNRHAIDEMLRRNLFGTKQIVTLYRTIRDKDPHHIHLDCMMNFIDHTAVIWNGLFDTVRCTIHDTVQRTQTDMPLEECLTLLGYTVFRINDEEQRKYACNFVNFDNFVLAQHPVIQKATRKRTVCVEFDEVNRLYGGIHCVLHDV